MDTHERLPLQDFYEFHKNHKKLSPGLAKLTQEIDWQTWSVWVAVGPMPWFGGAACDRTV